MKPRSQDSGLRTQDLGLRTQDSGLRGLALLALALLAGCAADTAVFRVLEYGAGTFGAEIGGCAIHRTQDSGLSPQIEFEYRGERCTVRATSK